MSTVPGNGSGNLTFKWLVGILVTAVFLLVGSAMRDMRSDLTEVQRNQSTRNEAQAAIQAQVNNLTKSLERIEDKLDKVLDGGRR